MINDSLVRARRLQQEAGDLMQAIRMQETMRPFGEMITTGSYFLDVMVYPDLDLYVPMTSMENIFAEQGRWPAMPGSCGSLMKMKNTPPFRVDCS